MPVENLMENAKALLPKWLPGVRFVDKKALAAGLRGGFGDNLSVDLTTGNWRDGSTGRQGEDLPTLYAAIEELPEPVPITEIITPQQAPKPEIIGKDAV